MALKEDNGLRRDSSNEIKTHALQSSETEHASSYDERRRSGTRRSLRCLEDLIGGAGNDQSNNENTTDIEDKNTPESYPEDQLI